MANYTQGEWCVDREDDLSFNINADTGKTWKAVAVVTANHLGQKEVSIEEAEANARLMSAAPDLLAALEAIADHLEFGDSRKDAQFIVSARAAIAKAKGA